MRFQMKRYVINARRNEDGDILGLKWHNIGSSTHVEQSTDMIIDEIEKNSQEYVVGIVTPEVEVMVVGKQTKPYLRTVADRTSKNNLDNLPTY